MLVNQSSRSDTGHINFYIISIGAFLSFQHRRPSHKTSLLGGRRNSCVPRLTTVMVFSLFNRPQALATFQDFWLQMHKYCKRRVASQACIFREACFSSLPTNACSTEDNIPFPCLANHIVLSQFWKVDLDHKVI